MIADHTIAAKIKKMLGLAEDQMGTPEGETAAALARKLMQQHAIEVADLDLVEAQNADPIEKKVTSVELQKNWMRDLFHVVGKHCEVQVVMHPRSTQMTIYGHRSGTEVCEYLYRVLARAIATEVVDYLKSEGITRSAYAEWLTGYTSYCASAVQGVSAKLASIRKAAQDADPQGAALVLRKADQVQEWIKADSSIKLVPVHRNNHPSFSAAGYEMGRNVSLHDGVTKRNQGQIG